MKALIPTLIFCLIVVQLQAQCQQEEQDYIALRALYLSTDGDNWTNNTGWLTEVEFIANPIIPLNTNVSTWYGVTTDSDGCVTKLNLWNNNLGGSIPLELSNLSNLTELSLGDNQLIGSIPIELGNLSNLIYLRLHDNYQLSGSIPSELGNLSNLTELNLYGNNLIGSIPPELGNLSNLTELNLTWNQLISGSIPLELGDLSNLTRLSLSHTQLSGSIPPELANLTNLTNLSLGRTQLSGSIPLELGDLDSLTFLWLAANNLSGNIPSELGNLNNLTSLSLSSNNLSGSIPPELANLTNLTNLSLNRNNLSGSIPPELTNLTNLTNLYLNNNQLSGCYDSGLLNLCNQLDSISNTNERISDGNNFDAPWEAFCAIGVDACDIPNVVLPGNFDNDAIVEGKDLLYWGAAYGYTGSIRPDPTTDWIPQYNIEDWATSVDGVNSKHQDANGDGTVDTLDLEALELNYGETYGIDSFEYHPTDAMFVIEELEVNGNEISFELHIASDTPISTHGISAKIDISEINNIYDVQIDTTGSSLYPDAFIYRYNEDIIDIALTRTDKVDQIIDGPVVSLVVMVKDVQSLIIPVNGGYAMSAAGELTSIGGSTTYDSLSTLVSLGVNHTYCNEMGTAEIYMEDASRYSCVWSTGATTTSIQNLDVGDYSVTVSDGIDSAVIPFEIDWAFTPVEVNVGKYDVYIDFEETPLSEDVEISLDGGQTYMPPVRDDVTYSLPGDNYQIWIQRMSDECPIYMYDFTMNDEPIYPKTFPAYCSSFRQTPILYYELEQYGTIDIGLYNIHGQRLRTLQVGKTGAGKHQIDIDRSNIPRGIYFIYIYYESNGHIHSKTLKILI